MKVVTFTQSEMLSSVKIEPLPDEEVPGNLKTEYKTSTEPGSLCDYLRIERVVSLVVKKPLSDEEENGRVIKLEDPETADSECFHKPTILQDDKIKTEPCWDECSETNVGRQPLSDSIAGKFDRGQAPPRSSLNAIKTELDIKGDAEMHTDDVDSHNKLFSDMSPENYSLVMENIKSYILATDLTYHLKVRADMLSVMSQTGFTWGNSEHRENLKFLMMTACDLSMSFKNPSDAKEVVLSLYRELYTQGDMEKQIGVAPLSLMDRTKQDTLPADQTSFLSLVSLPCFDILKEILPNAADLFHQCCNLRDYWVMRSMQPLPRNDLQVPLISELKDSSNN